MIRNTHINSYKQNKYPGIFPRLYGYTCPVNVKLILTLAQIAKGFGVYGTTAGSQVNLAIGAAVVNKATRFL